MFYRSYQLEELCRQKGFTWERCGEGFIIINRKIAKGGDSYLINRSVQLTPYPHCCGSMFLSNISSYPTGEGNALSLLQFVDEVMVLCGYTQISCIIPKINKAAEALFTKAGWKKVRGMRYKNARSDNWLNTWKKEYKVPMVF